MIMCSRSMLLYRPYPWFCFHDVSIFLVRCLWLEKLGFMVMKFGLDYCVPPQYFRPGLHSVGWHVFGTKFPVPDLVNCCSSHDCSSLFKRSKVTNVALRKLVPKYSILCCHQIVAVEHGRVASRECRAPVLRIDQILPRPVAI